MNKNILNTTLMILAGATMASAATFSDVPASHWAYQAVSELTDKGIIQGFPNGTFKGNELVSRYHLAMITSRLLASIEQNGIGSIAKNDLETIEKLTVEFADELALLGVKVTALEDDMKEVKEDVADLKKDVNGIKDAMKNGSLDKVRLSGDVLVRNYGFKQDRDNLGDIHDHRTETGFRLQLDTNIDENVSARARWNIIGNDGFNEWDGGNKNTSTVEIAYIKIKEMFGFGGDFKFGRDWFQHGHGFVIHNYMDAINYTKKCGDVDLTLNLFFERQGNKDYYNIYNANADWTYRGHEMYFGLYYNDRAFDENNNALADNQKEVRYEFGSYGKLKNSDDRYTYDLGVVFSDIEDGNGPGDDKQGLLGHVAFKYDSKKQLTAMFAYTYADDESSANINVENFNDYCIGDQTIFEDLYLCSMALNGNTDITFNNIRDYKLEFGYTLKNNDRHHFRLAYDHLVNVYDGKDNTFNSLAGNLLPGYINDFKSNIITFTYTYRLAENTRLKLGYQNTKMEANDMPDQCGDLYFTEIYSKY
jgi:hypothetical protein